MGCRSENRAITTQYDGYVGVKVAEFLFIGEVFKNDVGVFRDNWP